MYNMSIFEGEVIGFNLFRNVFKYIQAEKNIFNLIRAFIFM